MKKKIVFIAGTVRSGTTLINLYLKCEKVIILGEIRNLFWPTQKAHFEKIKDLKKDKKWNKIILDGPDLLYLSLAKMFPEIEVFIDSSKDYKWIYEQQKLNGKVFEIKTIIVFKSFDHFAHSKWKRDEQNWPTVYKNVYLSYFVLISSFYLINYSDFISSKSQRDKLISYIKIDIDTNKTIINLDDIKYNFFGSPTLNIKQNIVRFEKRNLNFDKKLKLEISKTLKNDIIIRILNKLLMNNKSNELGQGIIFCLVKAFLFPIKIILILKMRKRDI